MAVRQLLGKLRTNPSVRPRSAGRSRRTCAFPGQYFDVESGWNHNGFRNYLPDLGRYMEPDPLGMLGSARYYSPNTGSFLSEGPIGFAGGFSFYRYVFDDPIRLADPIGESPCLNIQNFVNAMIHNT